MPGFSAPLSAVARDVADVIPDVDTEARHNRWRPQVIGRYNRRLWPVSSTASARGGFAPPAFQTKDYCMAHLHTR